MKKIFILLLLFTLSFLFSCSGLFFGSSGDDDKEDEKGSIPKEYWGTWIRMDTGGKYYIDSSEIKKVDSSYGSYVAYSTVASSIKGYSLDGDNILKNGSIIYFRKGGTARDFSIKVAGFSDSRALRAISTGKQGVSGRRENKENKSDSETATSDANGTISFKGAVADRS